MKDEPGEELRDEMRRRDEELRAEVGERIDEIRAEIRRGMEAIPRGLIQMLRGGLPQDAPAEE
jgi:hypothetical protein